MPEITTSHLCKTFCQEEKRRRAPAEEIPALRDVSLRIADGSFTALIGPSGCGKTTLLRILAGLEEPTSGSVFFDGVCMDGVEPGGRDVSAVFQEYALYPHLNAFDNLAFPLRRRGMDKELIRRTVYGAARRLEIEYLLNRKPRHMSWGQRQRVALGRALCADHRILLLDEPFSGADPELRQELNRLVRELQQERGFTCLFCTHNLEDAFSLCSRLILMEDGSVLQSGAPEELLTAPRSRASAAFFVNDPYSFLSGKFLRSPGGPAVRVGDQTLSPLSCAPDALPDGGGVTVGCRSSQVRIVWGEGQPGLPGTLECSELRPGGGVLYTFRTPSGDVQALSQEALSYYTGAKAGLQINAGAAVLFRTEDGRALARKEG